MGSMNNLFEFNSVAVEKSIFDDLIVYSTVPYVREHCVKRTLRYTHGCTSYVIAACKSFTILACLCTWDCLELQ